jgi:hypothetical protein
MTFELSPEEIESLAVIRPHIAELAALVSSGAFEVRSGIVTLNFSPEGVLTRIERSDLLWRKGRGIVNQ